jgi:hypothetical protein
MNMIASGQETTLYFAVSFRGAEDFLSPTLTVRQASKKNRQTDTEPSALQIASMVACPSFQPNPVHPLTQITSKQASKQEAPSKLRHRSLAANQTMRKDLIK